MAYNPTSTGRKVLQNYRTKLSPDSAFESQLANKLAEGELFVQMGSGATTDAAKASTALWVLAADGVTPVKFISEARIYEMISTGASQGVDNIIASVGLTQNGGQRPATWGTASTYYDSNATVMGAIENIDSALNSLSGVVDGMDYELAADDNKVVTSLAQVDGKISGTSANITGIKLTGYTEGSDAKIADTDTLGQALGKLQGQINAMDLATVGGSDGNVIVAVGEQDGKVSATSASLKDVKLTGYAKDANATGAIAATDDLEDALSKLENGIAASQAATTLSAADESIDVQTSASGTTVALNVKSGEKVIAVGNDGVYTDIQLSAITPSSDTVKEEYALIGTDGSQLGTSVKIYKDQTLKAVGLEDNDGSGATGQYLKYTYILSDGTEEDVYVNVSSFLVESEFKSGVTADNSGVVHGVVDPASESFLTVGADGFKLSGVQDAIDTAVANASGATLETLDAEVTGTSEDGRVIVVVAEADGKLSGASVTLSDIASASALTAEVTRAKAAEVALDGVLGATKGSNDETRSYSHTNANYISGTSVKSDVEILDSVLGSETGATADETVVFDSTNTVAKSIKDLKAEIAAAKAALDLSAVDDNQYIATNVTTSATGTEIGISAITSNIADATSASTGLVDAYDAKQYAVYGVQDTTSGAHTVNVTTTTDSNGKKVIDFTSMVVDCGEFTSN